MKSTEAQLRLAQKIVTNDLSVEAASKAVRQRQGKSRPPKQKTLQFTSDNGNCLKITPRKGSTYAEMTEFLEQVTEEVRHRWHNNVTL